MNETSAVATAPDPGGGAAPGADARQLGLALDRLEELSGYQLEASLAEARSIEAAAEQLGELDLVWRARLVRADVWERQGRITEGARLLWEVNEYAKVHGRRHILARSHYLLSWAYRDLGDLASYLEHAVDALDCLDADAPAALRAQYLTRLADAQFESGSLEAARERYLQAEELAVLAGDVASQVRALNNLAYVEHLKGDPARAVPVVERLRSLSATRGHPLEPNTLDTIARVEIATGSPGQGETSVRRAIAEYHGAGVQGVDSLPEFLLTLATAQRHQGAYEDAQESLDRTRALAEEHGLASILARIRQEQAELHAATGRFAEAYAEHKAFHQAERALLHARRDAQARLRQAMFETTEARREADQFRDQARRDPLTGLYNRRHVNEALPALLSDDSRAPLVAALLDLDLFKRVNDTCSHQTGDEVLSVAARIFAGAVAALPRRHPGAEGFAARMGGEEFLVVLAGVDPGDAHHHLDALRHSVAEHDWSGLTGDLPVTVSVGVAVAEDDGDTQSSLLHRADKALYTAKRLGRNRTALV